jgi:small-conductance mechanosensitive channel
MLLVKVMNRDYRDYSLNNEISAPTKLSNDILKNVLTELTPSKSAVFIKLIYTQVFIGLITLTFCPQFKLSLTANYDLFHYFHHTFGSTVCMIICGIIFMAPSALFVCLLTNKNERSLILKSKGLYHLAISMMALLVFFLFGAQVCGLMTLVWLVGAVGSSVLIFELNYTLIDKRKLF